MVVPELALVLPDELPLLLPAPAPPQPNAPKRHTRKRQSIRAAFSRLRREIVIAANRRPRAITVPEEIDHTVLYRLICGISKAAEAGVVLTVMVLVPAAPETLT